MKDQNILIELFLKQCNLFFAYLFISLAQIIILNMKVFYFSFSDTSFYILVQLFSLDLF